MRSWVRIQKNLPTNTYYSLVAATTVTKTVPAQDMTSVPEITHEISNRGDECPSHNGLTQRHRQGLRCKKTNDDDKGVKILLIYLCNSFIISQLVTANYQDGPNCPEKSSCTDPTLTGYKTNISLDDSFINQLRKKDRRIQFLELKIQQLTEVSSYYFSIRYFIIQ